LLASLARETANAAQVEVSELSTRVMSELSTRVISGHPPTKVPNGIDRPLFTVQVTYTYHFILAALLPKVLPRIPGPETPKNTVNQGPSEGTRKSTEGGTPSVGAAENWGHGKYLTSRGRQLSNSRLSRLQ
jgi:hypothetical protein